MKKTRLAPSKLKSILALILATVLTLCLVEGICSFIVFVVRVRGQQIIAERIHTEHDPLLGWINKPNVYVQDMYGPGKHLRINSQRFRNDHDFSVTPPVGKRRWICSGDSFTFGYGVDNDHSWPALLASILPGIETVNMGQGGYGIDQAFLRYLRDGSKLQHQVLVFAFLSEDYFRMARSSFLYCPKPRLTIRNGEVIVGNSPVPPPGLLERRFHRYREAVQQLGAFRLTQMLLSRLGRGPAGAQAEESPVDLRELAFFIFKKLHNLNQGPGHAVLLVHLPTEDDYAGEKSDPLRVFLSSLAESNGWIYLDLIEDIRELQPGRVTELFIQEDIPGYVASRGHYTEKGNRYIADLIVRKIADDPKMAQIIGRGK